MRTIATILAFLIFAYAVIGAGFWWQWHSGMDNSNLAGYADNFSTFIFVVVRWPLLVI